MKTRARAEAQGPSSIKRRGFLRKTVRQKRTEATPQIIRTLWVLEHGNKRDLEQIKEVPHFTNAVIYWATLHGWKVDHTEDSRRTEAGFLDLWLCSRKRKKILHRELKTEHGKLTFEQKEMIEFLGMMGRDYGVWRPRDWERIKGELK